MQVLLDLRALLLNDKLIELLIKQVHNVCISELPTWREWDVPKALFHSYFFFLLLTALIIFQWLYIHWIKNQRCPLLRLIYYFLRDILPLMLLLCCIKFFVDLLQIKLLCVLKFVIIIVFVEFTYFLNKLILVVIIFSSIKIFYYSFLQLNFPI